MARHLHVGISRLNRAIADYSLARLEFALSYPDAPHPPVLSRVGGQSASSRSTGTWADVMKKVARVGRYIDDMRSANTSFEREPVFDRLAKAAQHVALLAWNMETMHRRSGGGIS